MGTHQAKLNRVGPSPRAWLMVAPLTTTSLAAVAAGLLLNETPPDTAPATVSTSDVSLASVSTPWWLLDSTANHSSQTVVPVRPTSSVGAGVGNDPFALIRLFISDGIDASSDCIGTACNGGNAGLFFGSGGNGANGGNGGNGGSSNVGLGNAKGGNGASVGGTGGNGGTATGGTNPTNGADGKNAAN